MFRIGVYLKNYLRTWQRNLVTQLATFLVLTGTFFAIANFLLISFNLKNFLSAWRDNIQMSVFLAEGISETEKSNLKKFIESTQGISAVEEVSQAEAKERFSQQLGNYAPDLLSDKDFENAFPSSLQVSFVSQNNLNLLKEVASNFSNRPGVENVSYGQEWVDKYASFVSKIEYFGWAVGSFLLLAILFVVGNSIRASIASRAHEIEVFELIGASPAMIRTPFIFEGFIMGCLSGTTACVVALLLLNLEKKILFEQFTFLGLNSQISFFSGPQVFAFILFSGFIGSFGSYLCLTQINDGWSSAKRVLR